MQNATPTTRARRTVFSLWIICTAMLLILGFKLHLDQKVGRLYPLYTQIAERIRLNLTQAHLFLEESLTGDTTVSLEKVFSFYDQSHRMCTVLLEGGILDRIPVVAVSDPETVHRVAVIRRKIEEVKSFSLQRLNNFQTMGPGTPADQEFDESFSGFLFMVDELAATLEEEKSQAILLSTYAHLFLIGLIVIVAIIGFFHLRSQGKMQNKWSHDLKEIHRRMQALSAENNLQMEKIASFHWYIKNIVDTIPSMIVGIDRGGAITIWNYEAEKFFGHEYTYAEGRSYTELLPINEEKINEVYSAFESEGKVERPRFTQDFEGKNQKLEFNVHPLINEDQAMGVILRISQV